jgi:murein DD-endopeptidase MepM/ murein hydrolase activator NlpD
MRLMYIGLLLFLVSCTTSQQALFSRKSPHEQYLEQITSARLNNTILGRSWVASATRALAQPLVVTLPYQESGYFSSSETEAQGYRFTARRGEQVMVTLTKSNFRDVVLFVDLWEQQENATPRFIAPIDSSSGKLTHEVKKDGSFLLRLQPELLAGVDYKLEIVTGPSLAFPVAQASHAKIGSFWGASRDAGARSHEGIDIFGTFRTPVVAAASGVVTSVSVNRLGGKVVFMRPNGRDYALYYAHLDSQLVNQGQRVKSGDTLGLMGNTGNAKYTPPHLHFGIYASGGAIDPLPFVNQNRQQPPAISAPASLIKELARTSKTAALENGIGKEATLIRTLPKNSLVQVIAAAGNQYKVLMPDSVQGFIPAGVVSKIGPIRSLTTRNEQALLDSPFSHASIKTTLVKGTKLPVLGTFGNYSFVETGDKQGWVEEER